MKKSLPLAIALLSTLAVPAFAQNQSGAQGGAAAGAATGAVGGAIVGGPVGAAVGAVVGGAAGATVGSLTPEDRTYVQTYVRRTPRQSVRIREDVAVGTTLPSTVTYYEIEGRPSLSSYRYAYVNDRYVLVDGNRRIVQVID
jgi:uncharacterized protein YcfJ